MLLMENFRLREKIVLLEEQLNMYKHDALTGLLMRRDFEAKFLEYFQLEDPFYITLIDINGLHNINRKLGYLEGDAIIKKVAMSLLNDCDNMVYRIGGDEFAILSLNPIDCIDTTDSVSATTSSNGYSDIQSLFSATDDKLKMAKKEFYKNSNERRL